MDSKKNLFKIFFSVFVIFFISIILITFSIFETIIPAVNIEKTNELKLLENNTSFICSEGILLDGFENATEWKIGTIAGEINNEKNVLKQGNNSLNITSVGGNTVWIYKTINYNFSQVRNIAFDVYVTNLGDTGNVGLYFSSVTNWSKQILLPIRSYLDEGWNRFVVNKEEFIENNEESWENDMVYIRIQLSSNTENNVSLFWDNLRINYSGTPRVMITHDGNYDSIDKIAEPILTGNGQKAVRFIHCGTIGDDDKSKLKDLQYQYSIGWDISNHGVMHLDLITLDETALDEEINDNYKWLIDNGFTNSAKFFCYPYGYYNDAVVEKVKENHVLSRDSTTGIYCKHIALDEDNTPFLMKCKTVTNFTTEQSVKDAIDLVVAQGGYLVLTFHGLVDNSDLSYNFWNKTSYQNISNYLKSYEDIGSLKVVTFSEYYNEILTLTNH